MSNPTPVPDQAAGEAPDPLVGTLFADRYRIIRKLGEGAMGAVYVGEHQHIGRRDAIKVLRPGLAGDEEAIRRFTRGTRNVSAIRHPNVCTVYDFSDTPDGVRYLAMEYVEGDTLKEILDREGRLGVARAVGLAHQVAEALQAAHEVGVVHRDLKPGNIMILRRPDGREQVKVVDFDIAKGPAEAEGDEVTRVGFVVGTPEYMSPEQLTGDRLDGRSDLYSLGVVLFRMLAGGLPFRATSTQEIMIQRLTGEPLTLQEVAPDLSIPAPLEQALRRALERRAQDRQASAAEFGREIVAALGTGAVPAAQHPAGQPAPELAPTRVARAATPPVSGAPQAVGGRKLAPLLIVGAVLVVAAAAVGGSLMLKGRQQAGGAAVHPDSVPLTAADSVAGTSAVLPGGDQTAADTAAGLAAQTESGDQPDTAARTQTPTVRQPPAGERRRPAGGATSTYAFGSIEAMLKRQLEAIIAGASGIRLQIVVDSATVGLNLAQTRRDSAAAAYVLGSAASSAGNLGDCRRWAQLAASLGEGAASGLLQACRQ